MGRMTGEIGVDIYTLLYIKRITHETASVYHRELYLALCGHLNGKEIQKRGGMFIHITGSLCRTIETNTHCKKTLIQ